jgi:hypothetical protein
MGMTSPLKSRVEQAAEAALYKYTAGGTPYEEEHFKQGFANGYRSALDSPEVREMRRQLQCQDHFFGCSPNHKCAACFARDDFDALQTAARGGD